MAISVAIPQDIIDNMIEAVDDDKRLLKKYALVSSSFLLPCRKRLFSKIFLGRIEICEEFHQFLVENPVVLSFVRKITFKLHRSSWCFTTMNRTSLIAIL